MKFSATLIIAITFIAYGLLPGYLLFLWDKRTTVNGKRKFDLSAIKAFGAAMEPNEVDRK